MLNDLKRKCCVCDSSDTYIDNSGVHQWFKYRDEKGNWDRKSYICSRCYYRNHYHNVIKSDPNSTVGTMKSMAKYRNKQLSKYSNIGKGFIGEQIIVNTRGLKNCNIELDNFHSKFDLSVDLEYGNIQVKTASLSYGIWSVSHIHGIFDTLFLICMDKNWKNVERVYVVPISEFYDRTHIAIVKNPLRYFQWYEKYRVDEKPYNETYHDMKIDKCSVLKKDE